MNELSTKKTARPAKIEVDPWINTFGSLLERAPGLLIRLGDWETRLLKDRMAGIVIDRPVYIAGLARSGSTILLELLARHPDVATHRYRDFPLLPIPWAWNWFLDRAGRTDDVAAERAHRDRIMITPESPEAFEEVLWMAFFPRLHDPRSIAVLSGNEKHPRFEAFYRDHIRKILLLRGGRRYVAKGNYNVTRLAYLKKLFPDARFIVPVRDPVWHIASLMKQHSLFVSSGRQDERITRYLRRAGHFEFGLDRRAINVGEDGEAAHRLWQKGEEVAGWAAQWAAVYGHVADILEEPDIAEAVKIVRYEDLCADPAEVVAAVLAHGGLSESGLPDLARSVISPPSYYEPSFSQEEREIIRSVTAPVAARFGYG